MSSGSTILGDYIIIYVLETDIILEDDACPTETSKLEWSFIGNPVPVSVMRSPPFIPPVDGEIEVKVKGTSMGVSALVSEYP